MLTKRFYLPIGILLVVICAVGLFSLRSDVPTEPIVIYKTTTPAAKSTAEAPVAKSQDGHFHADGTWHTEPHAPVESSTEEADVSQPRIPQGAETIAFGGETESQTPQPPSEEYLAEQRYDIAAAEYFKALQEYHKKDQELQGEWHQLSEEYKSLRKYSEIASQDRMNELSEAERREAMTQMRTWLKKNKAHWERREALNQEKPIRPTLTMFQR